MRTWGHEDMRIWGHEDMRIWGHEDRWGYEDEERKCGSWREDSPYKGFHRWDKERRKKNNIESRYSRTFPASPACYTSPFLAFCTLRGMRERFPYSHRKKLGQKLVQCAANCRCAHGGVEQVEQRLCSRSIILISGKVREFILSLSLSISPIFYLFYLLLSHGGVVVVEQEEKKQCSSLAFLSSEGTWMFSLSHLSYKLPFLSPPPTIHLSHSPLTPPITSLFPSYMGRKTQ